MCYVGLGCGHWCAALNWVDLRRDSSVSGCVLGGTGLKNAQESSCGGVKQIQMY